MRSGEENLVNGSCTNTLLRWRASLLLLNEQIPNGGMKSLSRTAKGDGEIFYGPAKSISDATYELKIMFKSDVDHSLTELFPPGIAIVGLPPKFRYRADLLQLTCTDR